MNEESKYDQIEIIQRSIEIYNASLNSDIDEELRELYSKRLQEEENELQIFRELNPEYFI